MPVLLFNHSEVLAGWAARQLPFVAGGDFGPCQAIGVASGYSDRDQLYAVIVFHDYQPRIRTIQVSMAARTPKWATRGVISALLHYPFIQLDCYKIWGAILHTNHRALRFNRGIGLRQDGILRHQFGQKKHAVILSMTKPEYERSPWYIHMPMRTRELEAA